MRLRAVILAPVLAAVLILPACLATPGCPSPSPTTGICRYEYDADGHLVSKICN